MRATLSRAQTEMDAVSAKLSFPVWSVSPRCCIRRSRMTHISSRVMSASGR